MSCTHGVYRRPRPLNALFCTSPTEARLNDRVQIQIGRPLSARKCYFLTAILKRGSALEPQSTTPQASGVKGTATTIPPVPGSEAEHDEIVKQLKEAEFFMGAKGEHQKELREEEDKREEKVLEQLRKEDHKET